MKKLISITLFIALIFSGITFAQHFWHGTLMPTDEVQKTWGNNKFDQLTFKNGTTLERSKMVYDLIQSKIYIGKSRLEVIKDLGVSDGYYFSGMIPAYILNNPSTVGSDLWQVVFLLNSQETVVEVVVHKNCCEK